MSDLPPYVGSLVAGDATFENEFGSIRQLTAETLPILDGLSIKRILLEPGTLREPQWNANANQIAYVVRGRVLVSLLGTGDAFATFVVDTGQMYQVESGAVYTIENVGEETAEIVATLRADRPAHFSLGASFGAMTDAVLGNTFDLPAAEFTGFPRKGWPQIVRRTGDAVIPEGAGLPNARLFDIEGQVAPLQYDYGSAKLGRKQFWAALEDLSMYSLRIGGSGMREPHWHPITAELGYVASGHGRMRVLAPDGELTEYLLEPGQAYFIPRAYPHHIEALEDSGVHFLVFFDQATPGDIGYRASASAFSREVLAASFGIPERDLPAFPPTPIDPLFVRRANPRDPIGCPGRGDLAVGPARS
jgi:oxalate decarboxylase